MSYPAIDNLPPIHPGEMLRDELEALGLSARRFAEHIGVPPNAVTEILKGERRVTAPMALRLGKAFGTDPRYWANLQSIYETKVAHAEIGDAIDAIKPLPHVSKAA
ncbi:addiction module antidote protein, HigA family (plasmid) [Azospirillum argentinense]|uniref:Addiction module antidote protein, HigA family n=1 Tax=Azospirillum argentinense TaxID=2970906 RepID=A0A4D8Q052_9PROT|nr:HigA family addiction module antitoxin [Azospirillum argentinense]QCO00230.1 addiction module antidote protein, HigA family [Azospirillum argentinense]